MPRFAANLSFLFTELPFMDRFEAAARAGFKGVEFHYPFDHDPYAVRAALDAQGLTPVLMNIRAGDHATGEWGFAGIPGREATFRLCLEEALNYAATVGISQLNCLAGVRPLTADSLDCTHTLIANLTQAATQASQLGMRINLEPINTIDVPGYLVATSAYAMHVLERVGAQNLKLQYDWYHMKMMGEDLMRQTEELLPQIGHIQFADAPGRHEPGTGEIDLSALFSRVDALGYSGWVSAEYRPSKPTAETLYWLPATSA